MLCNICLQPFQKLRYIKLPSCYLQKIIMMIQNSPSCNTTSWTIQHQNYCARANPSIKIHRNKIDNQSQLSPSYYHSIIITRREWVRKAMKFMLQNPNASVPESMTAFQIFSPKGCANWSIQQRVWCAHKKMNATVVPKSLALLFSWNGMSLCSSVKARLKKGGRNWEGSLRAKQLLPHTRSGQRRNNLYLWGWTSSLSQSKRPSSVV